MSRRRPDHLTQRDLDRAVSAERRRLRSIVRTIRGVWRRRMEGTTGDEYARAVQVLDEVLLATRQGGR